MKDEIIEKILTIQFSSGNEFIEDKFGNSLLASSNENNIEIKNVGLNINKNN